MRLPSFNDLLDEQKEVFLRTPDDSILVVGPPGSGKTSTALWKASILAKPPYNRRVVLITKNRLLAALASQISQDQGGQPVESVTMATFLTRDHPRRFNGRFAPEAARYDYIWPQIMATYEAASVQPEIDHLLIDEGQNLPLSFFIWARRFMARAVSVFADEDQTTDGNGCQVAQLMQAGFTAVLPLTVNHRNTQEIATVVEHFHVNRVLPPAMVKRGRSGDVPRIVAMPDLDTFAQAVATRYRNRGGSIGVITHHKVDVDRLHGLISGMLVGVRVDHYTSDARPGAEDAIRMREPGVTVLSSESAIGLEFDTVFLQDLWRSLPMSSMVDYRRMYMLCARARDTLVLVNGPVALNAAQLAALPPPPTLER